MYILPSLKSLCCPVTWWIKYISRYPASPQSPAFRLPDGSGLSVSKFACMLNLAGLALFVPGQHLTPHGLRRGAAQACSAAGLSIKDIKEAGSWKGETYKTYLTNSAITKGPSALGLMLGECWWSLCIKLMYVNVSLRYLLLSNQSLHLTFLICSQWHFLLTWCVIYVFMTWYYRSVLDAIPMINVIV